MSTALQPHVKQKSLAGPLTKSIIFVVVTALATAILALSIASTGPNGTVGYSALFTDVTGLTVGSDVDIAGVRIGQVNQIRVVDRNLALVSFSVESGRPLPVAVTATIKYLNLVGQRYINLEQGAGPVDQTLRPGATIPVAQTTPALNLTDLFNGFQPLFQALDRGQRVLDFLERPQRHIAVGERRLIALRRHHIGLGAPSARIE